jgi:hypothetical protein
MGEVWESALFLDMSLLPMRRSIPSALALHTLQQLSLLKLITLRQRMLAIVRPQYEFIKLITTRRLNVNSDSSPPVHLVQRFPGFQWHLLP